MSQEGPRNVFPRRSFTWKRPVASSRNEISFVDASSSYQRGLSLLEEFLDTPSKSPGLQFEAIVFKKLFSERDLEMIRDGHFNEDTTEKVWLYDRNNENQPRDGNGPMSTRRLSQMLKFKRFGEPGMVDANFRRIYAPNPDTLTLGTMILESPESQLPIIRRLILKYLTCTTTIGAKEVGSDFLLELHMFHYAWRNTSALRHDRRLTKSGGPVRVTRDLSYLSASTTEETSCLHEIQTSIGVTGSTLSTWTAIYMTDSYYDDQQDFIQTLRLDNEIANDDGIPALNAPKTTTTSVNNTSIKDPRVYFLTISAFHIARIKDEWENIHFQLREKVRLYITKPHITLQRNKSDGDNAKFDSLARDVGFVTATQQLLQGIRGWLRQAIIACYGFVGNARVQVLGEVDEKTREVLHTRFEEIATSLNEMERIYEELSEIDTDIQNFRARSEAFAAIEMQKHTEASSWNFGLTPLAARTKQALSSGVNLVSRIRGKRGLESSDDGIVSQPVPHLLVAEGVDMILPQEASRRTETTEDDGKSNAAEKDEESNPTKGPYSPSLLPCQSSVTNSITTKDPGSIFSEEFVSTQPSSIWDASRHSEQKTADFLYPNSSVEETVHLTARLDSTPGVTFNFTTWRSFDTIAELFSTAMETIAKAVISRPKSGKDFKKLRYKCGCGETIVLEVIEKVPGGIARLTDRLEKDNPRNDTLSCVIQSQPGDSSIPPIPEAAYFRSERSNCTSGTSASISSGYSSEEQRATSQSSTFSSQDEEAGGRSADDPQYLLLCVNQKALPVLVNVDVSGINNDQFLFQQIRLEYERARHASEWKPSFLIPSSFFKLTKHVSSFFKVPRWELPCKLHHALGIFNITMNFNLYKIHVGDFVRFQLIPVREATIPSRFKYSEFPPSSEVIGGKYIYTPVPMDEIELRIPLEHLILPGAHSDKFWIRTVPKKLKSQLRRYPGEYVPVIGWGVKVNENLNWSHLLRLILVIVFLIGGCLGLYSALKSDDSSAFGLGAFLTAVFAVYIPFQYYSWKEQIE